jgi:HPt (histidine-containing phosphotransfer) domain-containing protein
MKAALGGDLDVLSDILQSFADEADALVESLRKAADQEQWPTMARVAHTIKGSARDFGDEELASLCAAVEHDGRAGVVEDAQARAERIATACLVLKVDIVSYVRQQEGDALT